MRALAVILVLGLAAIDASPAQSAPGEPVAHRVALSPAALRRVIVRDSASGYGRRYERAGQLGSWLQTTGGLVMFGAVMARVTQRRCQGSPLNDQRQCKVIDEVFLGGAALYLASFGFSWDPLKGATGAFEWHSRAQLH